MRTTLTLDPDIHYAVRSIARERGDVSPAESTATPFARVAGYRQVTDAHLLALAIRRGGALATLDRGLAELAGPEARGALEVIRFKVSLGD